MQTTRSRATAVCIVWVLVLIFFASSPSAQLGGIIRNGSTNFLSTELFFEPEVGPQSLKTDPPTWNEMEQLLDNPYQVVSGAACNDIGGAVPGNDQGYPTYCTPSTFFRRLFFRDPTNTVSTSAALPPMFVHPLNYNPPAGAEMRLLNPGYAGGTFNNTGVCYTLGALCFPPLSNIDVSAGTPRVTEGVITYDVAVGRKQRVCG